MSHLRASVERQWYGRPRWLLLLLPLCALYWLVALCRRLLHSRKAFVSPVPVVVVGNIVVGGTGKTPTLIALVQALRARGLNPAVVSRGYGGSVATRSAPQLLPSDADALHFGDEPVLIARATGCAVAVGADRVACVQLLLHQVPCDLILSDDGLQHYRLARQWELVVVDGQRRLGNGWLLPVGPLREGPARLRSAQAVLVNGSEFAAPWLPRGKTWYTGMQPVAWRQLSSGRRLPIGDLDLKGACAFAGIGNPQRFFATLRELGFDGPTWAFADHHRYSAEDFADLRAPLILLTDKDAVKVMPFAEAHWWVLEVQTPLPDALVLRMLKDLSLPNTST